MKYLSLFSGIGGFEVGIINSFSVMCGNAVTTTVPQAIISQWECL